MIKVLIKILGINNSFYKLTKIIVPNIFKIFFQSGFNNSLFYVACRNDFKVFNKTSRNKNVFFFQCTKVCDQAMM